MKKNSINNILLTTVGLILVLAFININIFNHLNDYLDKKNQYFRENLELSDYSSFIEGEGEDINITIHQSLFNTTSKQFTNLDNANIFIQACPADASFNSSYVNVKINDIYAPNKSLIIEDDIVGGGTNLWVTHWTSFEVLGDCYLENFSVMVNTFADALYNIDLWTAKYEGGYITYDRDLNGIGTTWKSLVVTGTTSSHWENFTASHEYLNCSDTYNKTFFISMVSSLGNGNWDNGDHSDAGGDETITYRFGVAPPLNNVDMTLKVDLSPYIYPSSKEIIVENDSIWGWQDAEQIFVSFEVQGVGYLENISAFMRHLGLGTYNYVDFYILTAEDISGKLRPVDSSLTKIYDDLNVTGTPDWYNATDIHYKFNCSNTINNTYFLYSTSSEAGTANWGYNPDIDGDGVNESIVLDRFENPIIIPLTVDNTIDLLLEIDVAPLKNVPRPENIGLKINNTAVIGFSDIYGSGYWPSTDVYSSSSGQLEFELSADWWDVSCKITKVQINYTKTDLKASSKFTIMESGQDVQWNVYRSGGLNFFDPRITHHNTINFTIPATWLNINVFNGPENKTSDIKTRLLNNGYRDVEIIDATNGTFWYFTATSKNLVDSIDMYIGSNPINLANYLDVVEFNVTFNKIIGQNDGVINLCVYSPAAINNKLNFTSVNSTFDSGSEFYLGKWDLSDTVMEYGEFRVQVFWNNDTAAGFREKTLTITGQTDFTLITPSQEATYYSNQSFNIVVYYKDSNQLKTIDGATIQYNINGQGWQSTSSNNGTIGYYIIPVNCSIFTINGTKAVEITASKNYYESQTLDYNFNVIIVEEKGKQGEEFPLVIIIIAIVSTVGGIGVATVTIVLLRKRKRISKST